MTAYVPTRLVRTFVIVVNFKKGRATMLYVVECTSNLNAKSVPAMTAAMAETLRVSRVQRALDGVFVSFCIVLIYYIILYLFIYPQYINWRQKCRSRGRRQKRKREELMGKWLSKARLGGGDKIGARQVTSSNRGLSSPSIKLFFFCRHSRSDFFFTFADKEKDNNYNPPM